MFYENRFVLTILNIIFFLSAYNVSNTSQCYSNPGIDFSFAVPLRCVVCPRYLNSFTFLCFFSPDQLVYLHCLNGLSCILSFIGVFLGQLSDFLSSDLFKCFAIFCLFVCLVGWFFVFFC